MIYALIFALCLFSGATLVAAISDISDKTGVTLLLLTFIIGISIALGAGMSSEFTTKKPKKPIVQIECIGSKCDTSYIYKFK
jgi:uncharacterized membrane protein YbjE (DUF340 family)